jgi:hypothetical protein
MRRLWFLLSIVVLLAACSSAPQISARKGHASGHVYETRPPGFPNFVDHSVGREEISIEAMGLVGIPYRWGGNTPASGFDCSGLVDYVLARAADVKLPRTTAELRSSGVPIKPDEIAAGDLVFFDTDGRPYSHVGIYVGKLRFVNAPSTGGTVRLDYLNNPYWARHFNGIRRVAPPKRAPTPFDAPTWEASTPVPPAAAVAAAPVAQPLPASVPPAESVARDVAPAAAVENARSPEITADRYAAAAPAPVTATTTPATPVIAATPPPDAFEPPPSAMSAAQRQALAAGAVSPTVEPRMASAPSPTPAASPAPDAIDAAADAFEPPPSEAVAARQDAQAEAQRIPVTQISAPTYVPPPSGAPVQILRASTSAPSAPAPTQSSDDPIARFANSGY